MYEAPRRGIGTRFPARSDTFDTHFFQDLFTCFAVLRVAWGGGGSVKIKLEIKSNIQSKIEEISGVLVVMMKIESNSRNFEKLQRFSAFSTERGGG